ncbi:hypothetical protein GGR52DRAFT_511285 [Hypoxylon sp. FL1284]|nr:hypothetical protein GGR52DRAFT_511285 [Hypoxylon sp. FL1284]
MCRTSLRPGARGRQQPHILPPLVPSAATSTRRRQKRTPDKARFGYLGGLFFLATSTRLTARSTYSPFWSCLCRTVSVPHPFLPPRRAASHVSLFLFSRLISSRRHYRDLVAKGLLVVGVTSARLSSASHLFCSKFAASRSKDSIICMSHRRGLPCLLTRAPSVKTRRLRRRCDATLCDRAAADDSRAAQDESHGLRAHPPEPARYSVCQRAAIDGIRLMTFHRGGHAPSTVLAHWAVPSIILGR